jgi:hypothetical protein
MATADKKILFSNFVQILAVTAALALAACATTQAQTTDASAAPDQSADAEIADTFEGDGMEIPLDGTSLEAFEASLARVKEHTSEENYTTLENAIAYLLVYDLSAKRSKEKLAANLDGLNGYEVMNKIGWRRPPPGKSQAEKGAADAKIIDT